MTQPPSVGQPPSAGVRELMTQVQARRPYAGRYYTGARCAHCRGPQIGMAAISDGKKGYHFLCHPDFGLDCYRLVTVYGHGTPCNCRGDSAKPDHDRCHQCGYRRFEHLVDLAPPQQFDFLGNPVPCEDFLETPASDPFGDVAVE